MEQSSFDPVPERKAFLVYIDLEPEQDSLMHSDTDAAQTIRNVLYQRMPHYNPVVYLAPNDFQINNKEGQTKE